MPIPTSGQIGIIDIQNEFAGPNPAPLGGYYRGGSLVPINAKSSIPTAGQIGIGNFYAAFKPSSNAAVVGTLKNLGTRNYFFSRTSFGQGKEVNGAVSFYAGLDGTYARFISPVYNTFGFNPASTPFIGTLNKTANVSIIIKNHGAGATSNNLTWVNGNSVPVTWVAGHVLSHNMNISISNSATGIQNLTSVGVQCHKAGSNTYSEQESYILPGRWFAVWDGSANAVALTASNIQQNDIVLIHDTISADTDPPFGSITGISQTTMMNRFGHWYTGSRSIFCIADSNGSLTYNTGTARPKHITVFRMQYS